MNLSDALPKFKPFEHIYVEDKVKDLPDTKAILANFPKAVVIPIKHYKDVFNRPRQDSSAQVGSRALILGSNEGQRLFKGAPVCQDFGYDNFMYTASVQGCIYNCDYCFLKGMYATSNIAMFVNFDDYARDVKEECAKGPLYLCVSYDTDLQGLSGIIDYCGRWAELAVSTPNLTIEIRTKAANVSFVPNPSVIYAFSVSPDEMVSKFEHGTASFGRRMENIKSAIDAGCQVRLCFDPMIYTREWRIHYSHMMDVMLKEIDFSKIKDVSVGTVRVSSEYIKKFRKAAPGSCAVQFPFDKEDGYCVYPLDLRSEMTGLICERLKGVISDDRIYCE